MRDIFLYGAAALSIFFSGKIIEYTKIEYVYLVLSVVFFIAIIYSVAVFLKYTSLFTVINCTGSLIPAYGVKGDNKFAPISFGYMYDCIELQGDPEDAPVVPGLLTTISNLANICIPIVVGVCRNEYFPCQCK